ETSTGIGDYARQGLIDLMSDRGSQCIQRRDPCYVGKLGAPFVQGFFGKLALRHILESSDEERTTPALCHDAGHAPQVLHNASRSNNSESKVDIRARHAACDYTLKRRQVPGVDRVPNQRYRDFGCGIELEDAERFLGPVVLVRQQIRDEAACLAET